MTSFIFLAVVAYGIYYFFFQRRERNKPQVNRGRQLLFLSEGLFLLSVFFAGVFLELLNRNLGSVISPYGVSMLAISLGFTVAYWQKLRFVLMVSLLSFLGWWATRTGTWIGDAGVIPGVAAMSTVCMILSMYIWGRIHEHMTSRREFGQVFFLVSVLLVTALLFFFSTDVGLTETKDMTEGVGLLQSSVARGVFGVGLLVLVGSALIAAQRKAISVLEMLFGAVLLGVFASVLLVPGLELSTRGSWSVGRELNEAGVLAAVLFNVTLFAELLLLLFAGYHWRKEWLVNLGVVLLFLFLIVKYFDWLFTFLDKSVFFIGAGILLFAIGWVMERSRRSLLTKMKHEPRQQSEKLLFTATDSERKV